MNASGIKLWRRWLRAAIRCSHRGQAMAEFALVLTPCLTLFFGIINFALALYCYDFVCYSAQQAVRYATVHGSTATTPVSAAGVQTYVDGLVVDVLKTSSLTVTTTWAPNNNPGSVVTVVVTYNYPPLTSLVSSVTIPLTRTAAMVITQ
ncbi:TadE/TadG family type IV pilus assembly protein [Candidatus Binatus soli]|jgi:Flp pilus assembly protein TadG|uniref:TadE/TadG family type IV pilus assembly protein n=1 Tax=Candidatus Binatus soli TaxID=1953413 RepID=UPI003D0BFFA4